MAAAGTRSNARNTKWQVASRGDEPRTLADRAFVALHAAVLNGEISPGEHLLIEEVASGLGMSPMPVREALRRLDSVGLVEHIPHRGARVTELSLTDLEEVYEARLALETLALRGAAERHTEADAAAMTAAFDALAKATHRKSGTPWQAHTDFHFSMYSAAASTWLRRLIVPLWESSERYRINRTSSRRLDMRQAEHKEMLDAVLARDADRAALLIHDHLATTANELAARMGGEPLFDLHSA